MVKYVLRKLDFGYLVDTKKKILYPNQSDRLIRSNHKKAKHLKKKYKLILNYFRYKYKYFSNFKYLKKTKNLNLILKKRKTNLFFKFRSLKIRKTIKKKIRLIKNYFKKSLKLNFKNRIKKGIKKYIKLQERMYFNFLHRIKFKLNKKFQRKEYHQKLFIKKINKKKQKSILFKKKKHKKISKFKITINEPKRYFKQFDKFNKFQNFHLDKRARPDRSKYTTKKRNIFRKKLIKNFLKKLKKNNRKKYINKLSKIIKSLKKFKFKSLNLDLTNFGYNYYTILKKKSLKKQKLNYKYKSIKKHKIRFVLKNKNLKKISIRLIRVRKLKIKFYISKINIVVSTILKNFQLKKTYNILPINSLSKINFFNLKDLNSLSIWINFFLNFLNFYFFKFFKLKKLQKIKKNKKKYKYKGKANHFNLSRNKKNNIIRYLFDTQNSFFFFRFIRLSKKILDLFLPIKNFFFRNNNKQNKEIIFLSKIYHDYIINKSNLNKKIDINLLVLENNFSNIKKNYLYLYFFFINFQILALNKKIKINKLC